MTAMTIDERIDDRRGRSRGPKKFLEIMDRVTDIIFEIRDLCFEDAVHPVEVNALLQARRSTHSKRLKRLSRPNAA
jgi:hypothetical protein